MPKYYRYELRSAVRKKNSSKVLYVMLNIAKKTLHYLHGFRLGEPSAGRGALESKKRYRNPPIRFNIDSQIAIRNPTYIRITTIGKFSIKYDIRTYW